MTLAAIFLLSSFCASSAALMPRAVLPAHGQTAPQAPATKPDSAQAQDQSTQNQQAQNQETPAPAQNPPAPSKPTSPSATPAPKTPGQTTTTSPRFHHQKRVLPPNCNPAAAAGQATSGSTPDASKPDSSSPSSSTPAPSASGSAAKTAPVNCPPTKVIVRQGGVSDPSIQLAGGGAGGKTSNERDTANQMLESTKANLKKIAGHPLSASQQDMVNQTRQFMEQAKTAADAGDLERARTLAWKAQLLSEELVKPDK
jgi:hypothetical protein